MLAWGFKVPAAATQMALRDSFSLINLAVFLSIFWSGQNQDKAHFKKMAG